MKTLCLALIQVTVTFGLVILIGILIPPVLMVVLIYLLFFKLVRFSLGKIRKLWED